MFKGLMNRKVKIVYDDFGKPKTITGILFEATEKFTCIRFDDGSRHTICTDLIKRISEVR